MKALLCLTATILAFVIIGGNELAEAESSASPGQTSIATFAGGCFWCMEPPFDKLNGVISTTSGYSGGHTRNPSYRQVSAGQTGHAETLQVIYDPARISYEKLLQVFWHNVDPTRDDGQFCDNGNQYRPAIFYHNDEQKRAAEASKARIINTKTFSGKIRVEITKASTFYAAEDYHQDYYKKNPVRYNYYHYACGRAKRLKELWGNETG